MINCNRLLKGPKCDDKIMCMIINIYICAMINFNRLLKGPKCDDNVMCMIINITIIYIYIYVCDDKFKPCEWETMAIYC